MSLRAATLLFVAAAPLVGRADVVRYDDPRISFSLPAGGRALPSSDACGDYALKLAIPLALGVRTTSMVMLLSSAHITDGELEAAATRCRDVRLRNKSSWGVKKHSTSRVELKHAGARRLVRMSDELASVLGPMQQVMICGAFDGHLVCGVETSVASDQAASEQILGDIVASVGVKR